ncbi:MAG: hypothetical protein ACKVZJ_04070 [Phycisphaerales bacterium]
MNISRTILKSLPAILFAAQAHAQSINLDVNVLVGEGAGVPPSTYQGAAGQPGTWNNINASTPSILNLQDLDGSLSTVTLTRTTTGSIYVSVPNASSTGSFAALMDDSQRVTGGNTITYTFGNLQAGTYAVYTYAGLPAGDYQRVVVLNSSSYQDEQALNHNAEFPPDPNDFDFLNNHTVMLKTVANGGSVTVVVTPNSDGDPVYLSGIQLVKVATGRFRLYANDNPPASGLRTAASWSDANPDLEEALTTAWFAGPGVDVWAAGGTYKPNFRYDSRSSDFYVADGVHLYGGFSGTETSLNQRLAPGSVISTLSGEIGTSSPTDNSYRVLNCNNSLDSIVDNFVVTGGYANGTINGEDGAAGLQASLCDTVISNCIFKDNVSTNKAPIHLSLGGSIRFINCSFIDNHCLNADGGAVAADSGSDPAFEGIDAAFYNCKFLGNSTIADGGAAVITDANGFFVNCLFSGNDATSPGSKGGAISAEAGATVDLYNCTFGYNTTGGTCGGAWATGGANLEGRNCILWGNSDATGSSALADHFGGSGNGTFVLLSNSLAQGGNFSVNPQWVDAGGADNIFGTSDDNYRLNITSPAIDHGDNNLLPLDFIDIDNDGVTFEFFPIDLDRNTRRRDINSVPNTGVGTPPVDLGAYEAVPPPCVGDLNNDGARNTADLVVFLGQFGNAGNLSGDFNNDNVVNTVDLVVFLGVFGDPCP